MIYNLQSGTTEMKQYFHTLPAVVKQSVIQSGGRIETMEQLQSYVKNLTTNESRQNSGGETYG